MKILLLGATGMVGQGVLRECLIDPDVEMVQTVGPTATRMQHPKLREIVHEDLLHYDAIADQFNGYDACFFCLGISSRGMSKEDFTRITYGITVAAATVLSRLNPRMTFVYVSGAGTDSSEHGPIMWARVKGKTENALLQMPFAAAYMFRPGIIQPLHGVTSKTKAYRILYTLTGPVLPLLRLIFPNHVLTTAQLGRAMLTVSRQGYTKRILESGDIRSLAGL